MTTLSSTNTSTNGNGNGKRTQTQTIKIKALKDLAPVFGPQWRNLAGVLSLHVARRAGSSHHAPGRSPGVRYDRR